MKTNALISESSPYLLQHAHNPVNWLPWGQQALELAQKQDKPLLISIGYSACHWCHVMEKESFEDEATAKLMNDHFICIKVDREERPDIDQLYMTAVQLMSGRGGWPLNCFTLPDGKPFYGGTYFPRKNWQDVMKQLIHLFQNERDKVEEYALSLANGIKQSQLLKVNQNEKKSVSQADFEEAVEKWMRSADHTEGGPNKAPKFPLPNNYQFLLRFGWTKNDTDILNHVHLTLRKMAFGGIYDQLGGGFARYSTDTMWKVPHFEKMLYDNAQLISLYAEAWQQQNNPLYRTVCNETAGFIMRELRDPAGWFYSALDADSGGTEGLYYTWDRETIMEQLDPEDYRVFSTCFNINEHGYWEDERYILLRSKDDNELAAELGLTVSELQQKIAQLKEKMLKVRSGRIRPGLDNKLIVSWNGLTIRAFADLYRVFRDESYLITARKAAGYILNNLQREDGRLMHTPQIEGFLEDYCMMIDACIALYQAEFDETWLIRAKDLCDKVFEDFYEPSAGFFWFSAAGQNTPLSRLIEVSDNVIPAANSMMAINLHRLGIWFSETAWISLAEEMLEMITDDMLGYLPGYSNWGMLALQKIYPSFELAACGSEAFSQVSNLQKVYMPDVLISACGSHSALPFHEGRTGQKEQYFICMRQSCRQPVFNIQAVDQLLRTERLVKVS